MLQLVDDLSLNEADQTIADRYYEDLVFELGNQDWLTDVSVLQSVNGTGIYTPPASAIRPLAVFYDSLQLSSAALKELELANQQWRDELGAPISFVIDEETGKSFSVYPKPDTTGGLVGGIGLLGESVLGETTLGGEVELGAGFALNSISIIHTTKRTDVLAYLELPLAFAILALEFSRESDHQNLDFAVACKQLSDLLFLMVS